MHEQTSQLHHILNLWQELTARRTPGYAIGGLAGGEEKSLFVRVVSQVRRRTRLSSAALRHAFPRITCQCRDVITEGGHKDIRTEANTPAAPVLLLLVIIFPEFVQRHAEHSGLAGGPATLCHGHRVRAHVI